MKSVLSYFLAFLVSLIIFIGLPLLGWGLGDIPGFFGNPARVTYVLVIIGLQIFALIYNPQVGRKKDDRKNGVERRWVDLFLIQILSLAIVLIAPYSDSHALGTFNTGDALRFLGFLLLIPGFVLMQVAEKYLDKQFSIEVTVQKDHQLIQDGPYKRIRHPRYLGILAFFLGICVVFRSWLAILLVMALIGVLIWRINAEESLMRQEFGGEWEEYCQKSWRIIPYIF